ncbi:MAG: Flp family type IVb pilin, partial [Actinomycetota bacterium]
MRYRLGVRSSKRLVTRCTRADTGATAVEYALLVATLAGVLVTGVATLGGGLREAFHEVNDGFPPITSTDTHSTGCEPLPTPTNHKAKANWESRCGG